MSRLRIVCKSERPPTYVTARYPIINGRPAVFSDLEIFAVDSGKETPITNVTRVEWSVAQGTEPACAIVHFHHVDVDVDADVAVGKCHHCDATTVDRSRECFGGRLDHDFRYT